MVRPINHNYVTRKMTFLNTVQVTNDFIMPHTHFNLACYKAEWTGSYHVFEGGLLK